MELIFRALRIQVTASRDQVKIEGSVPVLAPEGEDLVTTERTLGWTNVGAYSHSRGVSWIQAAILV